MWCGVVVVLWCVVVWCGGVVWGCGGVVVWWRGCVSRVVATFIYKASKEHFKNEENHVEKVCFTFKWIFTLLSLFFVITHNMFEGFLYFQSNT